MVIDRKRNILLTYIRYIVALFFSNKIQESHLDFCLCNCIVFFYVCIVLISFYQVYINKFTFNQLSTINYFTKQ